MIDLEDAVPSTEKSQARQVVHAGIESLCGRRVGVFVRLNGVDTGLTGEDMEAVVTEGLDAVAVSKLEKVEEDVLKVDAWLELYERKAGLPVGGIEITVLPETARGLMDAYKLATARPRVGSILSAVGARSGDATKEIGYQWTRSGLDMSYMASQILLAVRAAGIEYPIGGGSLEVGDLFAGFGINPFDAILCQQQVPAQQLVGDVDEQQSCVPAA